ncbi:TPA: small subunit of terminase, partial [Enterococcus faecalis]
LNDDPFFILEEEIRILKVRQYRMLKRIKEAESGLNDEEVERLQQLRKVKEPSVIDGKVVTIKREVLKDVQVTRKTFRKLDDILAIEDALTRVSNQLTKSIKQLNELSLNQDKKVLFGRQTEKLDAEIRRLKIQNGEVEQDEIDDDGFVDAIKGIANDPEVWSDGDIET